MRRGGLRRLDAREPAPRLASWLETGKDAESGFGLGLMDHRIATRHPGSVKGAVRQLLAEWSEDGRRPAGAGRR